MTETALPTRSALAVEDTWNAESVFDSPAAWDAEQQRLPAEIEAVARHQAQMSQGPAELLGAFEELETLNRRGGEHFNHSHHADHVDNTPPDEPRRHRDWEG